MSRQQERFEEIRLQRLDEALQQIEEEPVPDVEYIQGSEVTMMPDADYRNTALQRLYNLEKTYRIKHVKLYYRTITDEAALLNYTISILNMMSPWLYYIRQDAKTKSGIPDITGCLNGRFFAFELKDNVGKVSAQQRKSVDKINYAHGIATCPRTINQVFTQLFACFGIYNF